ncbi:XRE family transcriptional regulator [Pedobacter frigoris]|uniref:helix-turn-helix domain-containing protein n=1 Tax=Pedobacter frigoris TaxID=2571272 RepID=UPI00292DCE56|nr:XRE family transcriptional regulator [Pedobacter frigoris]
MKQFPERLKNARKMNGLSLQELSDVMGNSISKQALNRLEAGEQSPDSEILSQLCKALHVTLDYFFKDNSVVLEHVEFRKLKKLLVKEQEKVKSATIEYLERYLELENLLGMERKLPFKIKSYQVKNTEEADMAAKEMRKILKIGTDPIYNIIELLEENNIKVYRTVADPSFSGLSTVIGNDLGVIVYNDHQEIPLVRKRFTVLHELGHLYMNLDQVEEKLAERLCDCFAGAMLLPDEKLLSYFGGKRKSVYTNELISIKKYYGISLTAIMYRAKVLGLVSESYLKYFMIKYNQNLKKQEKDNYNGREESNRFIQLLMRAVAQEVISSTKAAALNNQTLGDFREQYLDNSI